MQQWGGPVQEIRPGDVVQIPPGVKHWHGASPDAPMTHVALVERPDAGPSTEWMEAVSEEQYAEEPPRPAAAPAGSTGQVDQPSRAQQLMGDIAPRLAELTDDVLYGQVWASPELSQRDRSLVTVSALIALNRPDQLRSHLARARAHGVTQEERPYKQIHSRTIRSHHVRPMDLCTGFNRRTGDHSTVQRKMAVDGRQEC